MHDIIIVGAGVAGSHFAKSLPENVDYIIIDPNDIYLKDSGSVSKRIFDFYPDVRVKKNIRRLKIVGHDIEREFVHDEPFAYVIDRLRFWKTLRHGLSIVKEHVISINGNNVTTNHGVYRAKTIVGADGALSVVRNSLGIKSKIYFGAFGFAHPEYDGYEVHFDKSYGDGFAWKIPTGEYGLISRKNTLKNLKRFSGKRLKNIHAYPVPMGLQHSYRKNCILIGDAASQVKPITFGGIIYSLISAEIASKFYLHPREYERRWRSVLGFEIFLGEIYRDIYKYTPQKFVNIAIKLLKVSNIDYDFILSKTLKNLFHNFM